MSDRRRAVHDARAVADPRAARGARGARMTREDVPARPVAADGAAALPAPDPVDGEACDYCGAMALTWRKCKLVCTRCAQINKSCADL